MQLQSLMILLFMLFIVPIILLFANANIFFVIFSIVLFLISLRNIHIIMFSIDRDDAEEPDDDLIQDLELLLNINIRKFGKGIKVVVDLAFILFLVYCIFYINSSWIRTMGGIIILYWCIDIFNILDKKTEKILSELIEKIKLSNTVFIFVNSITIILITIVICNKFLKGTI